MPRQHVRAGTNQILDVAALFIRLNDVIIITFSPGRPSAQCVMTGNLG